MVLKEQMMKILVDADACPVVRITEQVAKEKRNTGYIIVRHESCATV